jgi:cytochrome c556
MKKLILTLVALTSFAFANDATMKSMYAMESGLNDIQKGFLYNQVEMIVAGAKKIKEANKIFKNPALTQKYLPQNKKHMIGVTMNQSKRIDNATDSLISFIEIKDMSNASNAYSDVINACSACHAIVRGW